MALITVEKAFELLEIVHSSENLEIAVSLIAKDFNETSIINHLKELNVIYCNDTIQWKYSCYIFFIISQLMSQIDLNSPNNALDVGQINLIVHVVQECAKHSIDIYIEKHPDRTTYGTTSQNDENYLKLVSSLRIINKFLELKVISSNSLFDDMKLDFLVGVLSVLAMKKSEEHLKEFQVAFNQIPSKIGTETFFKFLMMIKGFEGLSKDFQNIVHRELLKVIRSKGGYLLLCKNLLIKGDTPLWQRCNVISKIVETAVAKKNFQQPVVDEIFKTLKASLLNEDRDLVGACVHTIKHLESKDDKDLREILLKNITGTLDNLINPDTVLCGLILLEENELRAFVEVLHCLFSTSTMSSLPSKILRPYCTSLFNLYSLHNDPIISDKLSAVLIFILNNCDKMELQILIQDMLLKDNAKYFKIHPKVCLMNNSIRIGSTDNTAMLDDTDSFLNLIKNCNNNLLTCRIFISLLNILGTVQASSDTYLTGYDVEEEELADVLHKKFFKKLAVGRPLQEMIMWKSLRSQFEDNPKEVLEGIKEILLNFKGREEDNEDILILFFFTFNELLSKLKDESYKKRVKSEITKIIENYKDPELKSKITSILNNESSHTDPSEMACDDAIELLMRKEVYNKVYGIDTLIKLLKKRDKQTVLNRHKILALALENIKHSESYAYLNIIRLLVPLAHVMDVEVIDALIAEFQNRELNTDERLKFGEVIVKITENLGELSFKFKQQMINCFLSGARESNNEFRTSSLANLGTICKILSYQIHNFFNDMLQQLTVIIESDDYPPSKRAAVLVLSQLLEGMPNLLDFQEFLLPIYRVLKSIMANENDQQMRLHAETALEHLKVKTKDFLDPQLKHEKEIKIKLNESDYKIDEIKYK